MNTSKMPTASILAIGDELVCGDLVDSNSSYIAASLRKYGVQVIGMRNVGDDIDVIIRELEQLSDISDCIICTGGLGPTSDDLTRYAIARFVGEELFRNEDSIARLEAYAVKRGRTLNENSFRQVEFPMGATILENTVGTADAFHISDKKSSSLLFSLPGVPSEMKKLLETAVLPKIEESFPSSSKEQSLSFRCFGISESQLGNDIELCELANEVVVHYRPQFPEIMISLTSSAPRAADLLQETKERILDQIGSEYFFGNGKMRMPQYVAQLLQTKKQTLAAVESCSGGLLSHQMVSIPGASAFFLGSIVSYSNEAKEQIVGVDKQTLEAHGAVSLETASELAQNGRVRFAADYALSITGIAGPSGGSEEKPVGTVCLGIASSNGIETIEISCPWTRQAVREYSVYKALDLLRRILERLPFNSSL